MILLSEPIGCPQEFIRDNPELVDRAANGTPVIVGGTDYNLGLKITPPLTAKFNMILDDSFQPASVHRPDSTLLNDLVYSGKAWIRINEKESVSAEWYPSPTHLNDLTDRLGLTPGKDIFRFQNVDAEKLPDQTYLEYLNKGIFPQATRGSFFSHDHSLTDHVVGLYMLPSDVFPRMMSRAAFALANPDMPTWKGNLLRRYEHEPMLRGVASEIDTATFQAFQIGKQIMAKTTVTQSQKMLNRTSQSVWGIGGEKPVETDKDIAKIYTRISQHIAEFLPIVDRIRKPD